MLHCSVTLGLSLGMTLMRSRYCICKSFPGKLPLMSLMSSIIYIGSRGLNTILSLRIMSVLKMEACLHK